MSTISFPLFTQLVRRLRHTNARYQRIAYQYRHTYRPTHHAKRRACRVGLRIDTTKAHPSPSPSPISIPVLQSASSGNGEGDEDMGLRGLPEIQAVGDEPIRIPVPGAPRMRPMPLPECGVGEWLNA